MTKPLKTRKEIEKMITSIGEAWNETKNPKLQHRLAGASDALDWVLKTKWDDDIMINDESMIYPFGKPKKK